jgi:hypothetical protein
LCLASQKPSEWQFFVPAGTDLGVKLLIQSHHIFFMSQEHHFDEEDLVDLYFVETAPSKKMYNKV